MRTFSALTILVVLSVAWGPFGYAEKAESSWIINEEDEKVFGKHRGVIEQGDEWECIAGLGEIEFASSSTSDDVSFDNGGACLNNGATGITELPLEDCKTYWNNTTVTFTNDVGPGSSLKTSFALYSTMTGPCLCW